MKKNMIVLTAADALAFTVMLILDTAAAMDVPLPLLITAGTVLYHLLMRFAVGYSVGAILHGKVDISQQRWKMRRWEEKLYRFLNVRNWKGHMPTFDPDAFDPKLHEWTEIASASCQAETVHAIIAVLSYLPVLMADRYGAFPVFLVTSFLSSCLDMMFVIVQRFNRGRIFRMLEHSKMT